MPDCVLDHMTGQGQFGACSFLSPKSAEGVPVETGLLGVKLGWCHGGQACGLSLPRQLMTFLISIRLVLSAIARY